MLALLGLILMFIVSCALFTPFGAIAIYVIGFAIAIFQYDKQQKEQSQQDGFWQTIENEEENVEPKSFNKWEDE